MPFPHPVHFSCCQVCLIYVLSLPFLFFRGTGQSPLVESQRDDGGQERVMHCLLCRFNASLILKVDFFFLSGSNVDHLNPSYPCRGDGPSSPPLPSPRVLICSNSSKRFTFIRKTVMCPTITSFYYIRTRERAKYESVLHCSKRIAL